MFVDPQSKLEIHSKKSQNPKGAIVMFHGFGANCFDLVGLADYLDPKAEWDWHFPNGWVKVPMGGFYEGRAWYPIDFEALERLLKNNQSRDFKAPGPPEWQESLKRAGTWLETLSYPKLIVGGFSQGAMLASHLGVIHADKVAALCLFSGVLMDAANFTSYGRFPKPFIQSHGRQDQVLHYGFGQELYQALVAKGAKGEWLEFSGGHEIPLQVLERVRLFLTQ